jgi:hypothetical protein
MASATGVPQEHPQTIEAREDEPLLGGPGAVTQGDSDPIYRNLIKGTLLNVRFVWLDANHLLQELPVLLSVAYCL